MIICLKKLAHGGWRVVEQSLSHPASVAPVRTGRQMAGGMADGEQAWLIKYVLHNLCA